MGIRIFWAGDSTVAYNSFLTYPQTGIGQAMERFVRPEVRIENHGVNGRSTKSFLDESRLAAIYDQITAGDYLFIQFGHNDEKKEDPARYTDSRGEFAENLERFVHAARNKGAEPAFITPLYRRLFDKNGVLQRDVHMDYPAAMQETGKRLFVPVVDLCGMSEKLLKSTAPPVSEKWFMNLKPGMYASCPEGKEDNTHLSEQGAFVFAGLIARGLGELGGRFESLLVSPQS